MHQLSRQVRFAINPFAASTTAGANSYCAKPTADGLALFLALWVELKGDADKDTGFVINVSDIDKIVREKGVPAFDKFIKNHPDSSFEQIGQLLNKIWQKSEKDFAPARINSLAVELGPVRKLTIKESGGDMLYFSEKFEFAASHTLWNDKFSDKENEKIFGKCANRTGHGHNYIVEVTVKSTQQSRDSNGAVKAATFEQIVNDHFIRLVDHKNLNIDVEYFSKVNPTVENIAEFAFKELAEKFAPLELDCITVWENDRTFCCYRQ